MEGASGLGEEGSGTVSAPLASATLGAGIAGVALAGWLGARGIEPVATWLYPFVWYPLLIALEGAVALRHGRFLLLGRPRTALSILAWSVPLWMVWEAFNFRLQNWYYVFVPDGRAAFWTGVVVSFATVLPACFLPAALLLPPVEGDGNRGRVDPGGGPPVDDRPGGARPPSRPVLGALRLAGAGMLLLPLVWPRYFFPLVWGGFVLLLEPSVVRRSPGRSLVADALAGRWTRIGTLLGGGALAGLAWEALNALARARWIYTVPWLERIKLFEMPPLGFLGFPPLALSCFVIYQWLASRGWARPLDILDVRAEGSEWNEGARRNRKAGGRLARGAAVLLVPLILLGMEEWTVASRTPRLRDLPGLLPSEVERLRAWEISTPFELAGADPGELGSRVPGLEADEAERWISGARLATTRGIGTRGARLLHGLGVESLEELARTDSAALSRCLDGAAHLTSSRVRVWWRAARRAVPGAGLGPSVSPC